MSQDLAARHAAHYGGHRLPHPGAPLSPYKLVIHWRHAVIEVHATGHSPVAVREFERTISRNARVIDRITLQDSSGILETIWNRLWDQ